MTPCSFQGSKILRTASKQHILCHVHLRPGRDTYAPASSWLQSTLKDMMHQNLAKMMPHTAQAQMLIVCMQTEYREWIQASSVDLIGKVGTVIIDCGEGHDC